MVAQAKAVDEDSNGDGRLGKKSDPKSSMQDTLEKALGMDGKSLADIGEQHLGKNSVQEKLDDAWRDW